MQNTPRTRKRNNLTRLNLCFSNPMQPFTPESPPTTPSTTSSSVDHNRLSSPATSSTNFNDDHTVTLQNPFPNLELEPEPEPEPADLATAFASQRFFFTSPGRSNSIFESTNTDAECTTSSSSPSTTAAPPPNEAANNRIRLEGLTHLTSSKKEKAVLNGSIAVETYSSDPYADFRRSMEEMVEARPELMDAKSNWHLLHELLQCYLALNPNTMHKFIFSAFADLLVSLVSLSSSPPQNATACDVAGGREGCED